jgi:hypothetical protein
VPLEIRQRLESRVHETITEIVPKEEGVSNVICVYTPIYPGGRLIRNFPPHQDETWFKWFPGEGDCFNVWISSRYYPNPKQTAVNLRIGQSVWAKEISSWHYHPNKQRRDTIRVELSGPNGAWLNFLKADCDLGAHTIVFRKPKFLGRWWDIHYFDTVEFWSLFGGRYVNFIWWCD